MCINIVKKLIAVHVSARFHMQQMMFFSFLQVIIYMTGQLPTCDSCAFEGLKIHPINEKPYQRPLFC